jgi:hypothetical protein
MCILNQPRNTQDPTVNKLRAAMIHRGLWMGLLLKEARQRGLPWEELGHAAIRSTGCLHGAGIQERMAVPGSLVSFTETFLSEDVRKVFEIEVKQLDESEMRVEFGHCPLVTAWKQIGVDRDMIATLCDIAMSGDRGIIGCFPEFQFHLGRTIAQGHPVCEVSVTRG